MNGQYGVFLFFRDINKYIIAQSFVIYKSLAIFFFGLLFFPMHGTDAKLLFEEL